MKGKNLIKIIQDNNLEDFDIEVSFVDGYNKFPNNRTFDVTELSDIGYSSNQVSFCIEEK
jgi:hypothetical protein